MLKKLISLLSSKSSKATNTSAHAEVKAHTENFSFRTLLKEATSLKQQQDFAAACKKLKEAFKAAPKHELMAKDRLRLPMYLLLDQKVEEGERDLEAIAEEFPDPHSQSQIADQARVFYIKSKQVEKAFIYTAWDIAAQINRDRYNIALSHARADEYAQLVKELDMDPIADADITEYTAQNNPVADESVKMFRDRIRFNQESLSIDEAFNKTAKKLKTKPLSSELSNELSSYFLTNEPLTLEGVECLAKRYFMQVL